MTKAMDPYRVSQEDPSPHFLGHMESSFQSEHGKPPSDVKVRDGEMGERRQFMESPTQEPIDDCKCDVENVIAEGESTSTEKQRDPTQPFLDYPTTTATTTATTITTTTNGGMETPAMSRLAKLIWARKWKEAQILLQYGKQGNQDASIESSLPCLGGSMGLPLHLACTMRPLPPASFMECLVNAFPQACRQQQRTWGLLPLHLVADLSLHKKVKGFKIPKKNSRPTNSNSAILEGRDDDDDDTEVVDVSTYLEASTKTLETSNHLRIVRLLIMTYPESIYVRENTNGMLPIHVAASTARSENGIVTPTSAVVLETLLQAAPATKDMVDGYGDTPVALAWRETMFCCYQCGRKGAAPCLCKNRVAVATEYLHPLLREQIETISKPSKRVLATIPRPEPSPKSVVMSNFKPFTSHAHRSIDERQSSWDSEMTVKINNYTKAHSSGCQQHITPTHASESNRVIPAAITTAKPRNIQSQRVKKPMTQSHSNVPKASSTSSMDFAVFSSDYYKISPASPHPTQQLPPDETTQTTPPNKSTRGRQFLRGGATRSISPPPLSRNYLLPDPVALNHPVTVQPDAPLQQHSNQNNSPPVTNSPNHDRLPRSAMELRPRLATPPEVQKWEHFEPITWLFQPDAATNENENENQTIKEDDTPTNSRSKGAKKGRENKNADVVPTIQTYPDVVQQESLTQGPSSTGDTVSSPRNRNWSMLVCQRHDEGDYGHDPDRTVSGTSTLIIESKPMTKSLSPPKSSMSPPPVGIEDQTSSLANVESPGVASNSNQELALVQVLHMTSSPATTDTTDSSSSTSSKPERDMMTTTYIPARKPQPILKRQFLRLQVRFTELRRPISSQFPKRPPNPYYQLYVTNGTSVASVYQSRPLFKRTEGTWEEAAIDISPNPKQKHLPRVMDGSNSPTARFPKVLDHNWRIGFRVIHCHHSTADGKVIDPADQSNVIGLCRTSLDKLQQEPRQPILHGFQVMGWLEVTYLAMMH